MLNFTTISEKVKTDSKLHKLVNNITDLNNVIVLFSGGVDSSFLLYVCAQTLPKESILNIIGVSQSLPRRELHEAREFSNSIGVPLLEISTDELQNAEYSANTGNRCFHCKTELNKAVLKFLNDNPKYNNWTMVDGLQASDNIENRPGYKANEKYSIKHPLYDLKFSKNEIREYCKAFGLTVSDKPESACLASRVMVGTKVTAEILVIIEEAENLLKDHGFTGSRVRIHNLTPNDRDSELLARIELRNLTEMKSIIESESLLEKLKALPISFLTVDIEGYKEGGFSKGKLKVL